MDTKYIIALAMLFLSFGLLAQTGTNDQLETIEIDGQVVKMMVIEGDTIIVADLEDVSIASPRKFESKEDYRYWLRMRYHAAKVYPYAVEAIKLFRELEEFSTDAKKKERKKHIKRLQKELKVKYEDPLRNLTRTQGKVLTKMVERELGVPTHELIKQLRGNIKATFWTRVGRLWGYNLREGYIPEDDPILESVLSTFDITHDLE